MGRATNRGGALLATYDPARYGRAVGNSYDELYPGDPTDTEFAVALLADLALNQGERSILEFGIGTGRLALPLHRLGLRVAGIEGSESMLEQFRQKTDAINIPVVIGDYRDATVDGSFSVVVLAFNGILDPRGYRSQIDIFENAARHLSPGGFFVVESWVMSDAQRNGDWSIVPRYVGEEHVELQLARYNVESNRVERTLIHLRPKGMEFVTVADVYASPGQLDVMAEATNFDRMARYRAWSREPFTTASSKHITVYQLRG